MNNYSINSPVFPKYLNVPNRNIFQKDQYFLKLKNLTYS